MQNNNIKKIIIKILEKFFLILDDLFAIYLSIFIAFFVRKYLFIYLIPNRPPFLQQIQYYLKLYWIPLVYIFFNFYHKLYTRNQSFGEDAREYIKSYTVSFILIITIITLVREYLEISRITMVLFFINTIWINLVIRYFTVKMLYSFNIFKRHVLIIGAGETGIALFQALSRELYLGYKVIGFLDDDSNKKSGMIGGLKILGGIDEVNKLENINNIEKVFIAIPSLNSDKMMELYSLLHTRFKEIVIIPQMKVMALMNTEVHHLFNYDLLLLNIKNNLNFKSNIILKNVFDNMLTLLIFPLFVVVIALIATLIKTESKGPVFYKHKRYAMNGKELTVYKFRSMYKDAEKRLDLLLKKNENFKNEWDKSFKIKNDPRITRVGKILRKTSLDELPQIINVLKGEMSLIGPRPVIMDELTKYYSKYSDFFEKVRPGITGLWQVSGRSDTDYEYRVRSDLWYVLNWSSWLDIVILAKTFSVVIKGKGAY